MIRPAFQERLKNIKGIIWDLDNTLYAGDDHLNRLFDQAIAQAVIKLGLTISLEDAMRMASKSFIDHGYGGRVFIETMGVDPKALHHGIHGIVDETVIVSHDGFADSLQALSLHHVVVTHGARTWATRVLKHIGLINHFADDRIHALEDFDFQKKSASRLPFEKGLATLGFAPEEVIVVEDQERNLKVPHEMGIGTVLLTHGINGPTPAGYVDMTCTNAVALVDILKKARVL